MKHQQRFSELTLRALKETPPSLPAEVKDSVSLKKAMQGDGDWEMTKEILGWVVDTDAGTLRLSPKRMAELVTLLEIPPSQRRESGALDWQTALHALGGPRRGGTFLQPPAVPHCRPPRAPRHNLCYHRLSL